MKTRDGFVMEAMMMKPHEAAGAAPDTVRTVPGDPVSTYAGPAATLRRFRDPEIDYAARHLFEDLNRLQSVTLEEFYLPLHYHFQ